MVLYSWQAAHAEVQCPVRSTVKNDRWRQTPEISCTVACSSALGSSMPEQAHRMQRNGHGGAFFVHRIYPSHGALQPPAQPQLRVLDLWFRQLEHSPLLTALPLSLPEDEGQDKARSCARERAASKRQMQSELACRKGAQCTAVATSQALCYFSYSLLHLCQALKGQNVGSSYRISIERLRGKT